MNKTKKIKKNIEASQSENKIVEINKKIETALNQYKESNNSIMCYPFLGVDISHSVVDDIFQDLRTKYKDCNGRLNVIIDSGGGDIDASYNLSMLFRKYGSEELNFIIPRWAKSAATLLVCSGNKILMSPIAELGPLDPQITQMNPLEGRFEQFSPLHIESTLDLIRQEFEKGNPQLAKGLMERLQFPLTLGGFVKYQEIGKQYLIKLLETRMFRGEKPAVDVKDIAEKLTIGYADHGFCINIDECKNIGLKVEELKNNALDIIWEIHRLNKEKQKIQDKAKSQEMMDKIKDLPPGLIDKLPDGLLEKIKTNI